MEALEAVCLNKCDTLVCVPTGSRNSACFEVGLRAVPEIILGGGPHFFSDPSTPRTHMESEPPRPPGHVSALINPAP